MSGPQHSNYDGVIPEGSFALPGARRHDGASRTIDVLHIDLLLRPDFLEQSLAGVCTLTIAAIDEPVIRLDLDAVDFTVGSVCDTHGPLAFKHRNGTLAIDLRAPLNVGENISLIVEYRVVRPSRGLYFAGSGKHSAAQPQQCWTHGHAGGARHWFPCVDHVQVRQSSTMTIEVPAGLFALGNGELVEHWENAATASRSFRYVQSRPHASYLFTMVAGPFSEFRQTAGATPVLTYVTPGREADAVQTFGKAPAMIAAFERFTGAAYPFARYSQIAVAAFPFIGMENTTASTFTDEWLLDARTQATPAVESLVAHELAHQWFGNFLSSHEWSDVWLNEGFASYCEAVWDEAQTGWDAYAYNIFRQVRTYIAEANQKYTRPIRCSTFRDPIDLFDKHLYEKAAAVLHMLRGTLGEARFARAIQRYVSDNAGKSVETIDLIRAIEATSGRNLRAFFERWLQRSGHPVMTVAVDYDPDRGLATVRLTQRQAIDETHPPYSYMIAIGFLERLPAGPQRVSGGAVLDGERRVWVEVNSVDTVATIALDRAPALVRVDPGAWTLGEFSFELGTDLACATLAYDPEPIARIRAAQELAIDGTQQARDALTSALTADCFWGARVEYARLLGDIRADWARRVLLATLGDTNASVRRAVCAALGNYRDGGVAAALIAHIGHESAADVIGEALHALGKTRDPRAIDVLIHALSDGGWCDVIGAGALGGLAEFGDQHTSQFVHDALHSEWPNRRQSALAALMVLAERQPYARGACVQSCIAALDDTDAMTRLRAIHSLDALADMASVTALEAMGKREPIGWVRSHADRAAQRIRAGAVTTQRLDEVSSNVALLQLEHSRLSDRVAVLEV